MKVKELMMGTPYHCQPEKNLGVATELMWNENCGFLPVVDSNGTIRGVVTDNRVFDLSGRFSHAPDAPH